MVRAAVQKEGEVKIEDGTRWRNRRNKRIAKVESTHQDRHGQPFVSYRYESAVDNGAQYHQPHVAMQTVTLYAFRVAFAPIVVPAETAP